MPHDVSPLLPTSLDVPMRSHGHAQLQESLEVSLSSRCHVGGRALLRGEWILGTVLLLPRKGLRRPHWWAFDVFLTVPVGQER